MNLSDDADDTVQEVRRILQDMGIDIKDISARMRDYDGEGYVEGISENVKGILKECLIQYLKEHPEQQAAFEFLDYKNSRQEQKDDEPLRKFFCFPC